MDSIKGVNIQTQGPLIDRLKEKAEGTNFQSELKDAIQKVDLLQKEADTAVQQFSTGNATPHQTMIAVEKASLSFQMMLQVRNKIVSAYEEIMRIQV